MTDPVKLKFRFRGWSDDMQVIGSVVGQNEYKLPEQYEPKDVVMDIGAHIGSFCAAVYLRGARLIYAYETEEDNFRYLEENIKQLKNAWVVAHRVAVWRSDELTESLSFVHSELKTVRGGGNVLTVPEPGKGQIVKTVSLDELIETVTLGGTRRIHTIKFDCEGSEWPILFTSKKLHLVDNMLGEYHEIGGPNMKYVRDDQVHPTEIPSFAQVGEKKQYTMADLEEFLTEQGYTVTWESFEALPWLGKFWATRNRKDL